MDSYEERLRAVALYIKLGKRPKAVIRQLGYPTKNSLQAWPEVFQQSGDLHPSYVHRQPKYSTEQKRVAVEHYINRGRCFAFTRKALGYSGRQTMMARVYERPPEIKRCMVSKAARPASPLGSMRAAVCELCCREGSALAVAQRMGVDRVTFYN